jgi:zinc D-Ala-D-Ala carboxypeptidase
MLRTSVFTLLLAMLACSANEANNKPPQANAAATMPTATTTSADVDTDFLMGKFDPRQHPDFVNVGKPYASKPAMMLQKEVFEAFKKMHAAAKKEGIDLIIISSTRTFDQQKGIWEGKWTRFADTKESVDRAKRILEYSSMPGSSRHHWGTDIDLNDLNNPAFEGKGRYAKLYEWMVAHAAEYGFGQPYTPIGPERPNGYHEEKWHWSYLPLAKEYRKDFLKNIKNSDIGGFKGAETATTINVVEYYVGGVAKSCQ